MPAPSSPAVELSAVKLEKAGQKWKVSGMADGEARTLEVDSLTIGDLPATPEVLAVMKDPNDNRVPPVWCMRCICSGNTCVCSPAPC
jgi:hypothetical protein